jgi:C4-dicarboxylate transporter DctQ subunit
VERYSLPNLALMLFRFLQAGLALWVGKTDRIVAGHEVEDELQKAGEKSMEKN